MKDMIKYFRNDVKRINHALKVYDFACLISNENNVDKDKQQIIAITALLHDIGIKEAERKYQSSSSNYQEQEGPAIARKILAPYNINENIVDRVCYIIGNHHTYSKIDGIDFQILVEADFIVNIFEDSMKPEVIHSLKNKIFKTDFGTKLVGDMYLE
jgi:HD superfamily phosphodiesterase